MKVLCDVHISLKVVSFFKSKSIEAVHVNVNTILNSFYSSDKAIAAYADEHDYILITKDVDFRNSYFIQKSPKKLLRICLGNINNNELLKLLQEQLSFLDKAYKAYTQFYIEINSIGTLILT